MTLVNSNGPLPGQDISTPDIFLQATPVGPMPVPFTSMSQRATYVGGNMQFLVMGMPTHGVQSKAPMTISGPGPGAVGGQVCGMAQNMKGSMKLFVSGSPVTRALMDPTMQNSFNSLGNTPAPSQIKLFCLS